MSRPNSYLLAVLATCTVLSAHELSPTSMTLRLGGPAATFKLANGPGESNCSATISIKVNGDAVTVSPPGTNYSSPPEFEADFTVTPVKVGKATITVSWIAGVSDTCNGAGTPQIAVTVEDVPPPTPPAYEKQVQEPVSMSSGAYLNTWEDLKLRGPIPLRFERYYKSTLAQEGQAISALGPNWMHNYDLTLALVGSSARVTWYGGESIQFTNNGSAWTQTSKTQLVYQLQQNGSKYQMLDPGSKLVYTFDGGSGLLQTIQDRNGNTVTLTYNKYLLLSRVADGLGATLDFQYTDFTLTRVTDQSGRSMNFSYSGNVLVSSTNAAAATTSYRYSTAALITAVTLPRGNTPYSQAFDATGAVTSQTDAASNRTAFSFSSNGQSTMTDALSEVSTFIHSSGSLTQQTDPAGKSSFMSYDGNQRLTSRTDQDGNPNTIGYRPESGLIASTTYADGSKTAFTYAPNVKNGFTYYDLTAITYQDGTTEAFQYDSSGNVTARTGRNKQVWKASYNSLGQPLVLTTPSGGQIILRYTTDGTSSLASIQYPDTGAVSMKYDSLKRPVSRSRSDGSTASWKWDIYDHVVSKTDETGATTTYAYDANGRLSTITDAANSTLTIARTGTDQVSTLTDGASRTSTIKYDALDRPASVTWADGTGYKYGYDAAGNATTVTDATGKTWTTGFDPAGNAVSFSNPLGAATSMALDAMERPVTVTTSGGKIDRFNYDAMGRLITINDPLNNATSFQYDSAGAVTSITLPGGITSSYVRDAMERVSAIKDPNGNSWGFTYDGAGRLLSAADPLSNTTSFSRNANGYITKETSPLGSATITTDALGRPTHLAYSDGTVRDFSRDAVGRLTAGTGIALQYDSSGLISSSNGLSITRDKATRISQITLAPGKTVQYSYDARGLVNKVQDWAGGVTSFTYDDASRLVSIVRANGVTTTITYDPDSDVASIVETGKSPLSSISLSRDKRGLITSADRNNPYAPSGSDLASQQFSHAFDAASRVSTFTYDGAGNRLTDDRRSFTWDAASRMKSFAGTDGTSAGLTWNAQNLLLTQNVGGVNLQYVWNYALPLPSVSVVRSGSVDSIYYIHAPDGQLLYSMTPDGKRGFYHFDEQGNTIFLTDDSGAITEKYGYSEFGALYTASSTTNPFLFGGRWGAIALGSNLYSLRQRVYDGVTGSFLSRDPKFHLSPNQITPYQYAAGNPLLFQDLTGADPSTQGSNPVGTDVPDVISGAGNVAGTIGGELDAIADPLFHFVNAQAPENLQELSALGKYAKQADKLKKLSKPLNAAGNIGTAVNVVSLGINTYNFNNGINQAESEDDLNRAGAERTYQSNVRSIQQLYSAGKISAIQRNNLMLATRINYEDALSNLDQSLLDNLLFQGFNFFTSAMAQVPYVNDAAIALGNLFYK